MPYITRNHRNELEPALLALEAKVAHCDDGQLNFALTRIVDAWVSSGGQVIPGYAEIGRGIMALEMAKLEYYRRIAAPHEDRAIERNGDVYYRVIA